MAGKIDGHEPGIEPEMGRRVTLIRVFSQMDPVDFHRWLQENGVHVSYASWRSYERGLPMGWRTARYLCKLFPWLTMDYIYRGERPRIRVVYDGQAHRSQSTSADLSAPVPLLSAQMKEDALTLPARDGDPNVHK